MLRNLLVIALLFVTVVATYAQKKDRKKKRRKKNKTEQVTNDSTLTYKNIGDPLPKLKLTTRKGESLTEKDFENDANLIVMIFNPTCDHCQQQTIQFQKNIEMFKDSKLLLIAAPQMIDYLEFYNNITRYYKYPQMTVAVDSNGYIDKTYHYEALPQINIYDKNRKLTKIFYSETDMKLLEPYIE